MISALSPALPTPPTPPSAPQDVVNSHPGLSFLKEASEFHSRYITTVRTHPWIPDPRGHARSYTHICPIKSLWLLPEVVSDPT